LPLFRPSLTNSQALFGIRLVRSIGSDDELSSVKT